MTDIVGSQSESRRPAGGRGYLVGADHDGRHHRPVLFDEQLQRERVVDVRRGVQVEVVVALLDHATLTAQHPNETSVNCRRLRH